MSQSRKARIDILEARCAYLKGVLATQDLPERKRNWVVGEIESLEWALDLVKLHISSEKELKELPTLRRRNLSGHGNGD